MFQDQWTRWTAVAILILAVALVSVALFASPRQAAIPTVRADLRAQTAADLGDYIVLGWNDLGMHCYDPDFADMAVLPPFNTLWVQVVRRGANPQIVTRGITVTYFYTANTYSAGKTNFWDYAQRIFGLAQPLPLNVGLAGKGLAGTMDGEGDHFVARGIPLTEYNDQDAATMTRHPYQLCTVVVQDAATGQELARNVIVTPVSSELSCDNCHTDGGDATTRYPITPTGKVDTNILAIHDYLSQSQYPAGHQGALLDPARRPVFCAECHASNALGAPGVAGVKPLSNAMHNHHKNLMDITPDTEGCYKCHPGPTTQCLRDVMSQQFNFTCINCHGDMAQVALNPNPWLNEPRCDNSRCHGSGLAQNAALYRASQGHGGIYCAACHDSPHAIATSRESNDAIKFVNLQGHAGTLRACNTCHTTQPASAFQHRLLNQRIFIPSLLTGSD